MMQGIEISKNSPAEPLAFRGGPASSALPLAVFILATAWLVVRGAPAVEGMILATMVGLSLGLLVARNPAAYSERVFSLMANRTATVAVVCWLWAGAFSGILGQSGLVEAIVWMGWKLHLDGAAFTLAVFLSAGLFATAVGTGLGTVVGFTAVMYPAGLLLGSHPAALMGAIFSGAALGDNLAPVSDTTIVSAATQETDVGGVVRSRLKYVVPAAAICALLYLLLGGAPATVTGGETGSFLAQHADPRGLPMLLPALLVFLLALGGQHFLVALTAGIAAALIVGPLAGTFSVGAAFHITPEGAVAGTAVEGALAMLPISILTLLLVTAIGIMEAGGFLARLVGWLEETLARTATGTELAIVALISLTNLCVSVNTVAMVAAGPLANVLRKRHRLHPYRSANLLDTISCSFPYLLPYAATLVAAVGIQRQLARNYPFVEVLSWGEMAPYIFYGMVLFPLMILAVVTGFGRRRG